MGIRARNPAVKFSPSLGLVDLATGVVPHTCRQINRFRKSPSCAVMLESIDSIRERFHLPRTKVGTSSDLSGLGGSFIAQKCYLRR